jgi:hypothetical protein
MFLHFVFNEADKYVLQQAFKLNSNFEGEIFEIKDDYALGPLHKILEAEGYRERSDWWKEVLEHSPYKEQLNIVDDKLTMSQVKRMLTENKEAKLWVWMAQNAHDVCGYYWLVSQLKEFAGRVEVLFLNNLPFINEKGQIFYPSYLSEILPKEIVKATKLARAITLSEFEIDPDEFEKLCNENAFIRILEGGKKIIAKPIDFFDKQIIGFCTPEFQKLSKLINMSKLQPRISDAFLAFRIKQLQLASVIEVKGNWEKGWKEIEVKLMDSKTELEA